MLSTIKAVLAAILSLWNAVPEPIKVKVTEAAFSLIEHLVRGFFRSKQSGNEGKPNGNV